MTDPKPDPNDSRDILMRVLGPTRGARLHWAITSPEGQKFVRDLHAVLNDCITPEQPITLGALAAELDVSTEDIGVLVDQLLEDGPADVLQDPEAQDVSASMTLLTAQAASVIRAQIGATR